MQHILQVYTLLTCHETTQIGPFVMCFHPNEFIVYFIMYLPCNL